MKTYIRILLLLAFLSVSSMVAFAEPPGPPTGNPADPDSGGQPVGAPIDGGLGILLAMGAGYGARKYYKARKEKEQVTE